MFVIFITCILLFYSLISFYLPVFSTLCYDCVSLNQPWCTEHFVGKDVSAYRDNLINCTGNCMKLIAHVDEKRGMFVLNPSLF